VAAGCQAAGMALTWMSMYICTSWGCLGLACVCMETLAGGAFHAFRALAALQHMLALRGCAALCWA
jgi:hypothetical protein